MSQRLIKQEPQPVLLYRIVFGSRSVFLVALLLVLTFVLHPVVRAEAAEAQDIQDVKDSPTLEPSPEVSPRAEIPLPLVASALNPDTDAVSFEDVAEVVPVDAAETTLFSATSTDSATATGPTLPADDAAVPPTVPTEESSLEVSNSHEDLPTSSTSFLISPLAESVESLPSASSTELPLVHETYSDAEVRFLKRDCVIVDGGAYYCQARSPGSGVRDALIAEPDSDGDLEIFLVKDGEYHQLTYNEVDDAAPTYDGRSQTMVWHRMVGDAYVIYEYDFVTGEERALSRGLHNDMEPSRFGDRIVWQRWVDNHWQIILLQDDIETQLTTAEAHHLAPVIRGEMVMWQTVSGDGEKHIETLDLLTGSFQTINDAESAALANPRMMMVYEAVYENGDVVTRGVDLRTGEIISLKATPAELPEDIPESESTGETRALITSKPSQKEGDSEVDDDPLSTLVPVTSGSDSLTLDLRAVTSSTSQFSATTSIHIEASDLLIEALPIDSPSPSGTE